MSLEHSKEEEFDGKLHTEASKVFGIFIYYVGEITVLNFKIPNTFMFA